MIFEPDASDVDEWKACKMEELACHGWPPDWNNSSILFTKAISISDIRRYFLEDQFPVMEECLWSEKLMKHPYLAHRLFTDFPCLQIILNDGLVVLFDSTDSDKNHSDEEEMEDVHERLHSHLKGLGIPSTADDLGQTSHQAGETNSSASAEEISSNAPIERSNLYTYTVRNEHGVTLADVYRAFGQQ